LLEINNQQESKPQHPEPLAHGKLLHTTLHWENLWAAAAATATATTTGSKCACEVFGRPNRWASHIMQNPPSHPWDKSGQPPGFFDPPKKKNWTINSKLYSSAQQKGQDYWKWTRKGGGERS
jgi:hypothetical protein